MNNIIRGGLTQTMEGYYKVSVVDGTTNEIVWEQPELQKNLILNYGMDAVYSNVYADLLKFGIAGTGTRLNYIDPAGSMMSQTGTTVTLIPTGSLDGLNSLTQSIGGYSLALQVGDVIKYATGSGGVTETTVTAVENMTASVDTSISVSPSQSFTIWKTSQNGLQAEVKRAGTGITGTSYLVGIGNCSTSSATGQITYTRTFDFTTESVSKTYGEVGVAWTSTSGSGNIFSRVVLPSTVFVDVGQRIRVLYQLNVNLSPASASSRPNISVTGWPVSPATNTNGSESIQSLLISSIRFDTGATDGTPVLDPSSGINPYASFFISNVSSSLSAWGTSVSRLGASPTAAFADASKAAYTNGSYYCDKTATISAASYNGTNIAFMGIGTSGVTSPANSGQHAYGFLFEQTQSKANTQTLTLTYRWSWARTLSN